jgi:aldehyde:ferredoxin oxidoreductase
MEDHLCIKGVSIVMTEVLYGYAGSILQVDLNDGSIKIEKPDEDTLRQYLGGTGMGAKYLYERLPQKIEWNDPRNVLIFATGPLGGTTVPGSGTFSVVTKGALTGGATSSQANGFLGAYMKFSGFDTVVITGASPGWVYLYMHNGIAEVRDAEHLLGKDTWETEDAIKEELGFKERDASVFSIGPAGENLVRFAAIVGDRGHVVAHNGPGAVMGSKKLKAVVAARGKTRIEVKDKKSISAINKEVIKNAKVVSNVYKWGTSMIYGGHMRLGMLAIKNLTTDVFPEYTNFLGENYRPKLEMKWTPCWACQARHCHIVKVLEGPYAGFVGEEPEYEGLAAWGSLINQTDIGAAIMLGNTVDRLGMDTNEAGWLVAMLMECYEKGIIDKKKTGGIDLTWGNAEATKELLNMIARREGFGDTLADGVMRSAQAIGGEAPNIGVYLNKGHTPRGIDHRGHWPEMFDTATSSTGTVETGAFRLADSSPEEVSAATAKLKWARFFKDSLGICVQSTGTYFTQAQGEDASLNRLIELLNAVTGWNHNIDEVRLMGSRTANLLRVFDLKQGVTSDLEYPSPRYGSAPSGEAAKQGSIATHWDRMLPIFYKHMGWDANGVPLPETLDKLNLGHIIS